MTRYVRRARRVDLSRGKAMRVSAARYDAVVAAGPWHATRSHGGWYAMRKVKLDSGKWKTLALATFLTGWPLVDHIDGNGLNNCDYNLRPATVAQNNYNQPPRKGGTSKYKGVCLNKARGKWTAQIEAEGVLNPYLGLFDNELDAAHAYDVAAIQYHGEFAWLNCDHFDELEDYWRGAPSH